MKYIIMLYASQQDYDLMVGNPTDRPAWDPEAVAKMHAFMEQWTGELVESGEFVDGQGLAAPAHTRRIQGGRDGAPVVTDGPYPETQEVLAGYTIVECDSFDRATEIAARVTECPSPSGEPNGSEYIDVRPLANYQSDLEI
ncbi:MAG TPA: YciI family protein [Nocardioidaceae bacterium]|nr:YciI family protein [Nocardioidaceae bacterium]